MKSDLHANCISYAVFSEYLRLYDQYLPTELAELDAFRFCDILETLEHRKNDGNALLEKPELTRLVEWKLKHGTYRPSLAKLVAQNETEEVRAVTKEAFATYAVNKEDVEKSITQLSQLRGVGPATASLLLSCYDSITVPFFSDELFRYLHWSDGRSGGWDRKISYNKKEYKDLYDKTQVFRERLEKASGHTVRAIDIEKVAYALRKGEQQNEETGSVISEDNDLRPPPPKRQRKQVADPRGRPPGPGRTRKHRSNG